MTYPSLRCELPTLEPDDAFVRRLAELALASRPSPVSGVAVFGGPTGRSLAAAAAVAAIAAGAAAAASQMTHSRPLPAPPITSHGTDSPQAPHSTSGSRLHQDGGPSARQIGAGLPTQPSTAATDGATTGVRQPGSGPVPGSPGPGNGGPSHHPTDQPGDGPSDDPTSGGPTDDPTDDPSDSPTDDPSDSPSDNPSDGSSDGSNDGSSDGSGDGSGDGIPGDGGSGGLREVAD